MFNIFKNKEVKNIEDKENLSLQAIACLLIHSAKIDENFSDKEKEIIKKALIEMGAEEENIDKIKSSSRLTPDIIEIINKLLGKFSLTDTVEIVHRIGNIGKKEIYKKALDIQNEK